MSKSAANDIALFWNPSLADELLRFLTGRMKCPELAADLTQETYLRLHQRFSENPPDNARALAYKIALNLAIDYQRNLSVRHRFIVEDAFEDACLQVASLEPFSSQPEQTNIAQQQLKRLQTALSELPLDCRTVFLLHGVEGLKYAEIAERLDISISMVNRHLARAMAHCAQYLED